MLSGKLLSSPNGCRANERLHEVVTRAATLSSGIKVAGLGPVAQPEVEDVDISSVLKGHMELQTKLSDILKIINVDE